MVDIAPYGNEEADLYDDVTSIANELKQYSDETDAQLDQLERWLVINKVDTVLDEDRDRIVAELIEKLNWQGPVYTISAIAREGTQALCNDVMQHIRNTELAKQVEVFQSIPDAE